MNFMRTIIISVALVGALAVQPMAARPAVVTIPGSPLTIRIGDDTSFQMLDAKVSGIRTRIGGTVFSPGGSTAWTPVSMSALTGNGSAGDPYRVTVIVDAGTTGVRLTATYTYVNDDQVLRITKQFTSAGANDLDVYLDADLPPAPADPFTTGLYPYVWNTIAARQWHRSIAAGGSLIIHSAVPRPKRC